MGLSIGVSLAAYARAVGGVYGLSLLCPRCGLLLLGLCACYPVCGGLVCVLFLVCPVCGLGLYGWVACWHMLDFCIWLMPFPYFLGEVLSVFRFLWEPWLLVLFVGHCPFGNKFLIIQKKKRSRQTVPGAGGKSFSLEKE